MTVSSGVIEPFLDWSADAIDVPLLNGLRIQILPTFEDLYQAKRHQYAAFIASEALLVVWDDEPTNLLQRAKTIEAELLKFVWKTANATQIEKEELEAADLMVDEETGLMASKERPILLYNCFLVACSLCLLTVLIGLGYVKIADELVELQQWVSLAFLVMTPVNAFLTLVSFLPQASMLQVLVECHSNNYTNAFLSPSVLLVRHHQRNRSNHWANSTSNAKLEILLRDPTDAFEDQYPSARHYPMSRIQGRSRQRHPPHCPLNQKSDFYIRAPRRVSEYLHQRRRSPDHLSRRASSSHRILRRQPDWLDCSSWTQLRGVHPQGEVQESI